MWGGLFSLTHCFLMHVRGKEDFYNPVTAGAVTGGLLAFRGNLII